MLVSGDGCLAAGGGGFDLRPYLAALKGANQTCCHPQAVDFSRHRVPLCLVSSGSSVDRLHFIERDGGIWVSNSIVCLMATVGGRFPSDFSDSSKKSRKRANHLGRTAAQVADIALFIGDYAARAAETAVREGLHESAVRDFTSCTDAGAFLKKTVRKGDLILLKGRTNHHLSRVYLSLLGDVRCDLRSCSRQILCDRCPELGFSSRPELSTVMAPPDSFA